MGRGNLPGKITNSVLRVGVAILSSVLLSHDDGGGDDDDVVVVVVDDDDDVQKRHTSRAAKTRARGHAADRYITRQQARTEFGTRDDGRLG